MPARQTATPREARVIGAIAAAAGLAFMLVGLGLLPVPGGSRNLHAPLWVVFVAGLVFFLGGVAVLVQVLGGANETGELPADAPRWTRVVQYLVGVTIFASFALIGSWVAFLGEARQFSGGFPFLGAFNVSLARVAFGFGALVCWLCTIAVAVSGARRLFGGAKR